MKLVALALIDGGVSPSYRRKDGFSTLTRNGAGDYTLRLDTPYAATEIVPIAVTNEIITQGFVVGISVSGNPITEINIKTLGPGDVGVDLDLAVQVTAF